MGLHAFAGATLVFAGTPRDSSRPLKTVSMAKTALAVNPHDFVVRYGSVLHKVILRELVIDVGRRVDRANHIESGGLGDHGGEVPGRRPAVEEDQAGRNAQ